VSVCVIVVVVSVRNATAAVYVLPVQGVQVADRFADHHDLRRRQPEPDDGHVFVRVKHLFQQILAIRRIVVRIPEQRRHGVSTLPPPNLSNRSRTTRTIPGRTDERRTFSLGFARRNDNVTEQMFTAVIRT